MSLYAEQEYARQGKALAQPYINSPEVVEVPLQTMFARIERWVQNAVSEEDRANRVCYQQAFIHELYLHGIQ